MSNETFSTFVAGATGSTGLMAIAMSKKGRLTFVLLAAIIVCGFGSVALVYVFHWICPFLMGMYGGGISYYQATRSHLIGATRLVHVAAGGACGGAFGTLIALAIAVTSDPTVSGTEVGWLALAGIMIGGFLGSVSGVLFGPIVGRTILCFKAIAEEREV